MKKIKFVLVILLFSITMYSQTVSEIIDFTKLNTATKLTKLAEWDYIGIGVLNGTRHKMAFMDSAVSIIIQDIDDNYFTLYTNDLKFGTTLQKYILYNDRSGNSTECICNYSPAVYLFKFDNIEGSMYKSFKIDGTYNDFKQWCCTDPRLIFVFRFHYMK